MFPLSQLTFIREHFFAFLVFSHFSRLFNVRIVSRDAYHGILAYTLCELVHADLLTEII